MDGLRSFSAVDNSSAVDVEGLRRGTRSIHVKKPQFSEAFPRAVTREGSDELTLRAEEVGMQRGFIDTKHIELERWRPPQVDADWVAFSVRIPTKAFSNAGCEHFDQDVGGALLEWGLAFSGILKILWFCATSSVWKVLGKYGPHGEPFLFTIKKEPFALTKAVEFRPFWSYGDTEGMCFDWSALDRSRERLCINW